VPDDAQAWLLSATLSRRTGDLGTAQAQIERAAALEPRDPAIGLEAGVIAALGGRDDTARKSFESVVAAAPDSPQGTAAKQYLAQLAGR
jgi:Flp pilus assembly protein TadD